MEITKCQESDDFLILVNREELEYLTVGIGRTNPEDANDAIKKFHDVYKGFENVKITSSMLNALFSTLLKATYGGRIST